MAIEKLFSDPAEIRVTPTGIGAFKLTLNPDFRNSLHGPTGPAGPSGKSVQGPTGPAGSPGSGSDLSWERFFLTMGA